MRAGQHCGKVQLIQVPRLGLLTSHAVIVPIKMRSIAGVATSHGRRAGRARFAAVSECATAATGRRELMGLRRCRRRCAVTVIAAVPAVVVAALGVQAAAMGPSRAGEQRQDAAAG